MEDEVLEERLICFDTFLHARKGWSCREGQLQEART